MTLQPAQPGHEDREHDPLVRDFLAAHHRAHLEGTSYDDYCIQVRHLERYLGWLAFLAGQGLRESQLPEAAKRQQRAAFDRAPASAATRLSDLTVARVEGAIAWLLDGGGAKPTVDKFRRAIVAIWNRAGSHDDFPHVYPPPPKRIKPLKLPKAQPLAWSIDEFGRLLYAAAELPGRVGPFTTAAFMSALLWVVYNSGLRISATMAIRPSWLDLGQRRLVVDPEVQKDDEGSLIILLPETVEALRVLNPGGDPLVFGAWPYDQTELARGRPPRALTRLLKKCIVAAGLADSVATVSRRELWHKIRRTFATAIYAESGDIELVREMLGHSSVSVTWRYIDKSKLNRRTQADLLPRPKATQLRLFGG